MSLNRRRLLSIAGAASALAALRPARLFAAEAASGLASMTTGVAPIGRDEYLERIARARALMGRHGIGALLIEPGASMVYFTGVHWWRSERLTAAILPRDGDIAIVTPHFEEPSVRESLQVRYRLFFDIDPQHKGLLRLQYAGSTRTAIFSPEASRQAFELTRASRFSQFVDYGREGVWHIWIGFDHILFLLSLLLPAVLVLTGRRWEPVARFKTALWDVLKIVTAFTIAHSITLSLAALGIISLPTRLTESAIALSVVLAALNNIFPLFQRRRWMVAFAFGLIHGFGFASVLADLGLPRDALLLALVGFNLGVEAGQLAIVTAFLPAAYWLRRTMLYQRIIFIGGSMLICALAGMWLVERAFNLKLMLF